MLSVSKYRVYPSIRGTSSSSDNASKIKQETLTIGSNGQTIFLLAQSPLEGKAILTLNGVTLPTSSYTLINKTLTYIDTDIVLEVSDTLEVTYLRRD